MCFILKHPGCGIGLPHTAYLVANPERGRGAVMGRISGQVVGCDGVSGVLGRCHQPPQKIHIPPDALDDLTKILWVQALRTPKCQVRRVFQWLATPPHPPKFLDHQPDSEEIPVALLRSERPSRGIFRAG